MTQQQLAEAAGIHRMGLSQLERDEHGASWATVQALAKALGVTCSAFEGTVEAPTTEDRKPAPKGRPRKKKPAEGTEGESPPA